MEKNMDQTPLSQVIGSMLTVGVTGKYPGDEGVQRITKSLANNEIGGIILFGHNIESFSQLKELNKNFIDTKKNVFIMVDQEGGQVQRLHPNKGFIGTKSALSIVEECSPEAAKDVYKKMAKELFDSGISVNLAPNIDLHDPESSCIGKRGRSFSTDPLIVAKYGAEFIKAHHEEGILTSIKHFPGHGLAKEDTHLGMVDVTDCATEDELAPYYELIEKGKVDTIMIAHIINKKLDEKHPATLSPVIVKSLLREKGYDGVVVTDDLFMSAITAHFTFEESIIKAINAGCDILLLCKDEVALDQNDPSSKKYIVTAATEVIEKAIKEEKISAASLYQSYERIMKLKMKREELLNQLKN